MGGVGLIKYCRFIMCLYRRLFINILLRGDIIVVVAFFSISNRPLAAANRARSLDCNVLSALLLLVVVLIN